jgi:hypothetical protein
MYPSGSNFENDLSANIPNQSLMFTMYTTTFGNMSFMVTPPTSMIPGKPDQVQAGFPSVPYLSLEALLYQGQSSNPAVAPPNVLTGNTAGSQNINGQQTITNGAGQQVYTAGYSAQGF